MSFFAECRVCSPHKDFTWTDVRFSCTMPWRSWRLVSTVTETHTHIVADPNVYRVCMEQIKKMWVLTNTTNTLVLIPNGPSVGLSHSVNHHGNHSHRRSIPECQRTHISKREHWVSQWVCVCVSEFITKNSTRGGWNQQQLLQLRMHWSIWALPLIRCDVAFDH